jgi:enediyne biosynthesis protein E4
MHGCINSGAVMSESWRTIVMMIVSLLVLGCTSSTTVNKPRTSADPAAAPSSTSMLTTSDSLHVLGQVPEFTLLDQHNQSFDQWRLWGKVWIADFIFTRCTATCPQQTARFAELSRQLSDELKADRLQFVSFTVDPNHDTPAVLESYAKQHNADAASWTFLTGERPALWSLCERGFKLPVGEQTENTTNPFLHSTQFVLIDQQGQIRGYYDGLLAEDVARLKKDAVRIVNELKPVPAALFDAYESLKQRRTQQLAQIEKEPVFHQFSFTDRLPESGIRFRNRVVADAAKDYKATHYDHGNGLVVADVDGDGKHDLYFVSQLGGNELWRNLGDGRFENITEKAGVGVPGRIGVTASFADLDNDGDADLFVTTVRGGNLLFENDGKGVFHDVTEAAGVTYSGHSSGVVCFDYNRDGRLDLFVCNVGVYTTDEKAADGSYVAHKDAFAGHLKKERNEPSLMYRNEGGLRFVDVTNEVQLRDESWTGDATPIDANQDGWLDLYVLNMQGHNEYYENIGGQRFEKRSREVFPKTPWGAMGVKVFDFDNDGQLDIYITDMHSDMSQEVGPDLEHLKAQMTWPESLLQTNGASIWGNALYRRTAPGHFEEVSDRVGAENYWPWGFSVGDLNADGWDDVFIAAAMNFPFRYGINSLLLNQRGEKFVPAEFALGVEPRRGNRTAVPWFKVECSGPDKDHLDCKDRKGHVSVWSSIGSRSSVMFDLDDDGDLDIVTNDFGSEPMVLVSDLAERAPKLHWLTIKLVGTTSNRDGLGATVKVTAGSQSYLKVLDGKSGYLSQSVLPLYFGLGDAEQVETVEVTWPNGRSQTVNGPIKAGTALEIREE